MKSRPAGSGLTASKLPLTCCIEQAAGASLVAVITLIFLLYNVNTTITLENAIATLLHSFFLRGFETLI